MEKNNIDFNKMIDFYSKKQLKRNSADYEGCEQTCFGSTYEVYRTPDGKILKSKFRTNVVHYKKTAEMAYFKTKEQLEKEKQLENPNSSAEEKLKAKMGEEKYAAYLKRKAYINELTNGK